MGDVNENGIKEVVLWGGKFVIKGGNIECVGSMVVIQWLFIDVLQVKYNFFYFKFDIEECEDQFWFDGWGNWQNFSLWNYQNFQYDM